MENFDINTRVASLETIAVATVEYIEASGGCIVKLQKQVKSLKSFNTMLILGCAGYLLYKKSNKVRDFINKKLSLNNTDILETVEETNEENA